MADVFYEFLAFADGSKAASLVATLTSAPAARSMALVYYNVNSCNASGQLYTWVTADIPSYAVFDKGSVRTYTAYNPEFKPITVTFSDGFSMDVPPRAQIIKTGPATTILKVDKREYKNLPFRIKIINTSNCFFNYNVSETIKKIEIFSIKGEKIFEYQTKDLGTLSKKVFNHLPRGTYLIKEVF